MLNKIESAIVKSAPDIAGNIEVLSLEVVAATFIAQLAGATMTGMDAVVIAGAVDAMMGARRTLQTIQATGTVFSKK